MGNTKSTAVNYPDGPLEINLSNFKLLRVVGKGSYGKVILFPVAQLSLRFSCSQIFLPCQTYRAVVTFTTCAAP